MVMLGAGGIECGVAMRAARVTVQIFTNGQFPFASAAQNCRLIELRGRPNVYRMVGDGDMAVFASVVNAAAFHFDGDDVQRRVVVKATGVWVEMEGTNFRSLVEALVKHGIPQKFS